LAEAHLGSGVGSEDGEDEGLMDGNVLGLEDGCAEGE
jgi:hypothetical protein